MLGAEGRALRHLRRVRRGGAFHTQSNVECNRVIPPRIFIANKPNASRERRRPFSSGAMRNNRAADAEPNDLMIALDAFLSVMPVIGPILLVLGGYAYLRPDKGRGLFNSVWCALRYGWASSAARLEMWPRDR